MLMNKLIKIQLALSLMILAACTGGPPGGLTVVKNFELERYQGIWFEIARLDHRFERGLSQVSAEYRIQADNTVQVINRGFDVDSGQWEQAVGKARFIDTADQGALKVSFFGPFYGAYNIVALDQENYQWVMVTGPSYDYLWILSRQPALEPDTYNQLLEMAAAAGFAVNELIVVSHNPNTD